MAGDERNRSRRAMRLTGRALNATIARAPWLWPRAAPGDAALLRPRRGRLGRAHRGRIGRPPRRARGGHARWSRPIPSGSSTSAPGPARRRCSSPASFPAASVRGVDISEEMIRAAQAKVGLDPDGRIAFRVADAAPLPYDDESFDLVAQLNMPPFFAEIARVLRPGGHVIVAASWGAGDPVLHPRAGARARLSPARDRAAWRAARAGAGHLVSSRRARSPARLTARWPRGDRHLLLVNPSAGGGPRARAAAARPSGRCARPGSSTGSCSPRASSTAAAEARRGGRRRARSRS